MRNVIRGMLVLGLVIVLAQPSLAQQRQRGRGQGQGGVGGLLTNPSVQKELKLDEDQTTKIKEAVQQVRDKHKDDFAKLQDLGQDERPAKQRELNQTVAKETMAAVSNILKPEQLKRLHQIELQQAGTRAFTMPEVEKALTLTAEQKEKIKSIAEDSNKEMRELRQGGQSNQEKIAALRKETNDKVQAVLTDEQKKTWKDLTGEPFTMQRARRPGGNNQ
jgi:hypothetical protein